MKYKNVVSLIYQVLDQCTLLYFQGTYPLELMMQQQQHAFFGLRYSKFAALLNHLVTYTCLLSALYPSGITGHGKIRLNCYV